MAPSGRVGESRVAGAGTGTRSASASILTVIVPARPGTPVTASATRDGAGRYRLRVAIGRTVRILLVSAGGTIQA